MPQKPRGWRNPASAANGRAGGRPKVYADVRLIAADVPALLDWLNQHEPPREHPARRGWEMLIAGLWAENAKNKE